MRRPGRRAGASPGAERRPGRLADRPAQLADRPACGSARSAGSRAGSDCGACFGEVLHDSEAEERAGNGVVHVRAAPCRVAHAVLIINDSKDIEVIAIVIVMVMVIVMVILILRVAVTVLPMTTTKTMTTTMTILRTITITITIIPTESIYCCYWPGEA